MRGAVGPLTDTDGTVVVTDADAAAGGVAAASAWPEVLRMLQRLHRDDDGRTPAVGGVPRARGLPLERVLLIAVGNDRVRDRVRAALNAVGLRTRVAVYPPWFQPRRRPRRSSDRRVGRRGVRADGVDRVERARFASNGAAAASGTGAAGSSNSARCASSTRSRLESPSARWWPKTQ